MLQTSLYLSVLVSICMNEVLVVSGRDGTNTVFQILTCIPSGAESSIPMGPTLPNFVKAFNIPFTYVQVLTG